MNSKTKRVTTIGMLCAITYVTMVVGRIPIILFLKYDPSDVIVTLGGFIWGPMTSCIVSVIVATLEMITVSDTGILGCIMNIVQTLSFACTASVIYKKKHTLSGAVIGLASGWLITVVVMLLWNYLVTPLYMGYPREAVVELLLPAFLPFNLLKGGLNASITFLLYKPIVTALRKSGYVAASENEARQKHTGLLILASFLRKKCKPILTISSAVSKFNCLPMFQFQFSENSIPRSHSFPLFPIDCSNPTPCPFVRCFKKSFHICKSKVFHPASHILPVFPFSFCIANAFVPIRKLSDFISHLDC